MNDVSISKFLSLVLRHEPQAIGIVLDSAGWISVDELLAAWARHKSPLTREHLERIVATSDKKRFAFSEDGQRIRANQGHSVAVELDYKEQVPPETLFHGTATRFLDSIKSGGLVKGARHHVHLSIEHTTAVAVGVRHGKPVVLTARSGDMHRAGHHFYLSANGVWLVDQVPAAFIGFPS